MQLILFRRDIYILRYIYLKFGKVEVLSAYEYEQSSGKTIFKLELFNKKVVEFER